MMNWHYDKQTQTWKLLVDGWRAMVLQSADSYTWFGIIKRTDFHHEQYESPEFESPQKSCAWCETEIAKRLLGE